MGWSLSCESRRRDQIQKNPVQTGGVWFDAKGAMAYGARRSTIPCREDGFFELFANSWSPVAMSRAVSIGDAHVKFEAEATADRVRRNKKILPGISGWPRMISVWRTARVTIMNIRGHPSYPRW